MSQPELTPTMRMALRHMAHRALWHPNEVPGGRRTIQALMRRGYVAQDGQWVHVTPEGELAVRGVMA